MHTRPSRLYLPKFDNPPKTVFEYLLARFPQVPANVWTARLAEGKLSLSDGTLLKQDSSYRHGLMVYYRKEVPSEPVSLQEPVIVYRDDEIMVVDKPHGMPVTPSGEYVERSLLFRLQRSADLPELAPMHRLDRDTAGLLLFTINKFARARYHRLFADGNVDREYFAIAPPPASPDIRQWRVENRLEPGVPWYCQRIVEGAVNAITEIELLEIYSGLGFFRLHPHTGRKHQLRIHMASIGCPIIGDPFYPSITQKKDEDPPMQLLAYRLSFIDPVTGGSYSFTSNRKLALKS